MEKIIENSITIKKSVHKQYCDICGKYLGDSAERNDGFYKKYGDFVMEVFPDNGEDWYYYKKQLCENCKSKVASDFIKLIRDFGFKTWEEIEKDEENK